MDLGDPQRLEELLRPGEVRHPDADGAQAGRHVGVRSGPGDDAVLRGEALRLLVEGADRHARVVDLDRVDVVEDRQEVLVVRDGVHPVERMGDIDDAALALDLRDGLLQRHAARDLLREEQPDDLAL